MKKLLFMIAAVVMLFTACDNQPEHIYDDHSADLVGTWTCLTENYAEALIINADGTAVSYGVEDGEYWENVHGTVVTEGNNITMTFDDDDNLTGHFDIIPGMAFSLFEDSGERYVYQYCANDLSDEILGMWVCTQSTAFDQEMSVNTYQEDGKALFTGYTPDVNGYRANLESTYKVIGDLLIQKYYVNEDAQYITLRLNYVPNATRMGDILTITSITTQEGQAVEQYASLLRIKQHLELPGMKYDYIKTFVTNVKGEDKDIPFLNTSFNFAKMDGSIIDKFLKSILFTVEFPEANKIKYSYLLEGKNIVIDAPIEVDGNKMTIKMSENNAVYRDIEVYMFQDQDNTQMHMYMPVTSFENFFGNINAAMKAKNGELDLNNAEAVAQLYSNIENAIETINVSFIFKTAK